MKRPRRRTLTPKDGELVYWHGHLADGEGPDYCAAWAAPAQRGDMNYLLCALKEIGPELARRGYDLRTMKFTIQKKVAA